MTHASTKEDWFTRMAELEANADVSVGGLAVRLRALERDERRPELMALGKLIELRRREKGLSVQELTSRAHVTEVALADLERGLWMPSTRGVVCLVAKVLDLPTDKLLTIAGLNGAADPDLQLAALKFAAQAEPPPQLTPSEQAALGEFLQVLQVA
jgi:transcriptional regulator with XRE-family HTH domain